MFNEGIKKVLTKTNGKNPAALPGLGKNYKYNHI
jgi:hypothetical protein